jgi:hypothetical protein
MSRTLKAKSFTDARRNLVQVPAAQSRYVLGLIDHDTVCRGTALGFQIARQQIADSSEHGLCLRLPIDKLRRGEDIFPKLLTWFSYQPDDSLGMVG